MSTIPHLSNLSNIRSLWRRSPTGRKAYSFDWVNDYIAWKGNLWTGVAVKWTDWTWAYVQCYNTGFDMWTIAIDNRSVQTIKWRGSFDSFAATPICFGYWGWSFTVTTISMTAIGKIQVEIQGTWSARIQTTNTFLTNTEYNIIVRVNNTLPSWTARVVWDVDIFVNGVLQGKWITSTWNSTVTSSQVYWGAYSTTLCMTGKMRSLDIWNVALTDWECWTEGVSATVVNTTWLIKSYTPSDVWINIGRTGYDLNAVGNVTTGSDWDWSYLYINWNRDGTTLLWTSSGFWNSITPTFTQATSFTIKARVKFESLGSSWNVGIFWSWFDTTIDIDTSNRIRTGIRSGASSSAALSSAISISTLYDVYLVYDASTQKYYWYLWTSWGASVALNAWGTAIPWNFTTDTRWLGDGAVLNWNNGSLPKKIYHAAIRNRALSQAEVDADIALWNTTKSDPTIVAYYVPENLQYNTDYITNKDFTNAAWTKTGTTPTGGQADLRWGTDACILDMAAWAGNGVTITNNSVTGSVLASKTFKLKVFARTASWTATMRLRISHNWVATYYSSDFTVTTTPQEFTFTQALTSSTSGTWMTYWIEVGSGAWAATFIAYYPTDWLTDQTLRDESPNIGGYLWWKLNRVFSYRCKPWANAIDNANTQNTMAVQWIYSHIRTSTNIVYIRVSDRVTSRSSTYTLWAWFRSKVHVIGYVYWNGSAFASKLYINWVLQDSDIYGVDAINADAGNWANLWVWRRSSAYYTWLIRDARIYTWTITDADALAIYNGLEPSTATLYLRRRPTPWETGTTAIDHSGNSRTGTLTGGTTRVRLSWS